MLATALLGALAMSFAVPNVWQRVFDPKMSDASGRNEIWNVGLVAMKHYGIFGSGFGTFPFAYTDNLHEAVQRVFTGFYRPAHNVLVQTIVEMGVPGMIFLLTAWWQSIRQNRAIPRSSIYFPDRIASECGTAAIFISALSIDLVLFKYLWLDLMMVVLLANVYRPRLLAGRLPVVPRRTAMPQATAREPARL
jgi:O-antigen ligase